MFTVAEILPSNGQPLHNPVREELPTPGELAPERKGPEWPVLWTARLFIPTDASSQLCSVSTVGTTCL